MDLLRLGSALRVVRVKRGWRQRDVASRSGCSQPFVSKLERGHLGRVRIGDLVRVAAVLEVRLDLRAHWRGSALDRLLANRHSAMHEIVSSVLLRHDWEVASEVSFSIYGERGVIDVVGWHAAARTLLIVELKTELVDVNNLLETSDRRERLARTIARDRGWDPSAVASWIVLAESRTNRRRLAAHRTVLRTAFPHDGRSVRGWLADPTRRLRALSFLTDIPGRSDRPSVRVIRRVRKPTLADDPA